MSTRYMVSVVCTTFNHAEYIRQALDSFLIQETTFPYEIIVHDDASTDGTADIVREYQRDHPDKIRAILQSENQYSRGGFKPSFYAAKQSSGAYIALCEGDDYWSSPQKLQLQVEAMEKHPEIEFSFHNAMICQDGEIVDRRHWDYGPSRVMSLSEVLSLRSMP